MKNVAVVLAGGIGTRFGGSVPKQFVELDGREVIEHSIDTFCAHPGIDEVAVVVHADWRAHFESLAERRHWAKLAAILDGGAERWQSTLAAIGHYSGQQSVNLLLHDAARPWISADTVSRVTEALLQYDAVAVAVPSTDTLFRVADGCIADVPSRADYWCAQTPQAFRLAVLSDAYRMALEAPTLVATDDCGILHRFRPDIPIHIVAGNPENKKITYNLQT